MPDSFSFIATADLVKLYLTFVLAILVTIVIGYSVWKDRYDVARMRIVRRLYNLSLEISKHNDAIGNAYNPKFIRDTYVTWLNVSRSDMDRLTDDQLASESYCWYLTALKLGGDDYALCYGDVRVFPRGAQQPVVVNLPWLEVTSGTKVWVSHFYGDQVNVLSRSIFQRRQVVRLAQRVQHHEICDWLQHLEDQSARTMSDSTVTTQGNA